MLINRGMDADLDTGLRLKYMDGLCVLHTKTGKR